MSFTTSSTTQPSHSRANSTLNHWPPLVSLPTAAASTRNTSNTLSPPNNMTAPVWSPYEGRWVYSSTPDRLMGSPANIVQAGSALREHTDTPYSIHSVAASMHMHIPDTLSPGHMPPAPVHARASSDPIYRPSTVAPHTGAHTRSGSAIDPDAPLPNPFPLVASAEVRRFGSVPSGQFYTGHGGTYNQRNATHLAGALGRTPPRAEIAVAAADPVQWKRLVFTAATGRVVN